MPWSNPLVAGLTLIRTAIKSPNYVAGVSGWMIAKDGSAEFNNVTVRGAVDITNANGSSVQIFNTISGPEIDLQPPNSATPGVTFGPGQIYANSFNDQPRVVINGATRQTPSLIQGGSIQLGADKFTLNPSIDLDATNINIGDLNTTSSLTLATENIYVGIDQTELGRGQLAYVGDTSDSAAVGTSETVILTTPSTTFRKNRAYRVQLAGRVAPSVAANPAFQIRKTNAAGQSLHNLGRLSLSGAFEFAMPNPDAIFTVGASDVTAAICLTMLTNTGTVVQRARRWMAIYDVGVSSQYPDASVLV